MTGFHPMRLSCQALVHESSSRSQDHHQDLRSSSQQRNLSQPLATRLRLHRLQDPPDIGTAEARAKGRQRWTRSHSSRPTRLGPHRLTNHGRQEVKVAPVYVSHCGKSKKKYVENILGWL